MGEQVHRKQQLRAEEKGHARILLAHANHNALVTRTTDDGGENSARSVVSREAGLNHTGTVVNDKSSNLVVSPASFLSQQDLGISLTSFHL